LTQTQTITLNIQYRENIRDKSLIFIFIMNKIFILPFNFHFWGIFKWDMTIYNIIYLGKHVLVATHIIACTGFQISHRLVIPHHYLIYLFFIIFHLIIIIFRCIMTKLFATITLNMRLTWSSSSSTSTSAVWILVFLIFTLFSSKTKFEWPS
jgi:hypothetical protein